MPLAHALTAALMSQAAGSTIRRSDSSEPAVLVQPAEETLFSSNASDRTRSRKQRKKRKENFFCFCSLVLLASSVPDAETGTGTEGTTGSILCISTTDATGALNLFHFLLFIPSVFLFPNGKTRGTHGEIVCKQWKRTRDAARAFPGQSGVVLEELPFQEALEEELRDAIVRSHGVVLCQREV